MVSAVESPLKSAVVQWAIVLAVFGLLFSWFAAVQLETQPILDGDGWFYGATCLSLSVDGDLDLSNQFTRPLEFFSSHVALGADGRVLPKHPVLMPFLTVPFLRKFGMAGFAIFNLAVSALAMSLVFLAARHHASAVSAFLSCLTVGFATFVPWYVWQYSPDMFSSLLVVAGLALLWTRNPASLDGLALSWSVLAKPTNLVVWAAGLLTRVADRRPRQVVMFLFLSLPAAITAMALNWAMFGSVFTSGYQRILIVEDGLVTIASHTRDFDLDVVSRGIAQLVDPRLGLVTTSPILLLVIPAWVILFRRDRRTALSFLGVNGGLFLLFSAYRLWDQSYWGNRFLLTLALTSAVPLAVGIEALLELGRNPAGAVEKSE